MKFFFSIMVFSLFSLSSCKNNTTQNENIIHLYSIEGELLASTQKPEVVARIQQTIAAREKTLVKILPIYKHYIELLIDNKKQTWLISSLGYIQPKDSAATDLYKIEKAEALFKYLR